MTSFAPVGAEVGEPADEVDHDLNRRVCESSVDAVAEVARQTRRAHDGARAAVVDIAVRVDAQIGASAVGQRIVVASVVAGP